ncbi:MAG: complex I NDUFA9 subunit family protein [Gammaproteobacteria bacterium]|nr:complex I NDUFA9 subunit family protein [Gammaproteobacteria bacterium]
MAASRVCILGGSGFVGTHLVSQLSSRGVVCRIFTRHPHRVRNLAVNLAAELVTGELFDSQSLANHFSDCDAVINLIGILNEDGKDQTFRRFHVDLVDLIVDACNRAGIARLLHMSALHADEARGSSLYLRSKGEGENRAHTHGGASIAVTSFRPSVIFGPGDSFFNRFASLLKFSPLVFPLACPDARFAPIYVGDVAEAFVRALDDRHTYGKHYDLCGPDIYSLKELVEYTARTFGYRRLVVGLGDLPSRLQAQILGRLPGRPFSMDNYFSLQTDSICEKNGFAALGIEPRSIASMVPRALGNEGYRNRFDRYRKLV